MLVLGDSSHADLVIAHNGRAPRDIAASLVLMFEDTSGERRHAVCYPGEDQLADALAGARNITVRWADSWFRKAHPELFPIPAA